jgi:hypothetical protein
MDWRRFKEASGSGTVREGEAPAEPFLLGNPGSAGASPSRNPPNYTTTKRRAGTLLRSVANREKPMAACDTGYICDVCGHDVEAITESDLYLRYIMGEVSPLELPRQRERHIRCNPATAQYIIDPAFEPIVCAGMFAKGNLDADFVRDQETLVTRAWQRLQAIPTLGLTIPEYPLPEVLDKWKSKMR